MPTKPKRFEARQKRFCQEYVIDLHGERAAIRAGYSAKTARVQAAQLLARLSIQAELGRLQAERAARTEVTADRVVTELAKLGFANMLDYLKPNPTTGTPHLDYAALTRDQGAAVQEVVTETVGDLTRVKFKLADKRAALVDIGRHLGMFKEQHEHTGKDGAPLVPPADPTKIALVLLNILSRARPEPDDEP